MKVLNKIKAGALQFVLFIGTIIALMLFAFVLLNHNHNLFNKKTDALVNLIRATDNGLVESFNNPISDKQFTIWDGSPSGVETIVQRTYWGLMEKRTVTSKKGKLQFQKTGFVGHQSSNRPAVYLKDENRPMVIAGDAKIIGDAYLPERGVKMGNIQGYGYARPRLIYGKTYRSTNKLPALSTALKNRLKLMTSPNYEPIGVRKELKRGMNLENSFLDETIVIQGDVLDLEQAVLTGNIVLWAAQRINVRSTSRLNDVILIAPTIVMERGTKGSFQAISNKEILVGEACELDYPTILSVLTSPKYGKEPNNSNTPRIHLKHGTTVAGTIMYLDEEERKGVPEFIQIDKGVTVKGEVQSNQSLELKGKVYGTVVVKSFVSFENGNTYLNHLFNGQINSEMLPKEYVGIVHENSTANGIVKWLY